MSTTLVRTLLAGGEGTLAVPLALAPAARIHERDWQAFLTEPTQLANGIRDLVEAMDLDGVPVSSDADVVGELAGTADGGPHCQAAVEATGRLRQSFGDRLALVAVLPGPSRIAQAGGLDATAAADRLQSLAKRFLAAGADVILVRDEGDPGAALTTLANIARFHQALALSAAEPAAGLPLATVTPLDTPERASGVVVTDEQLPRETDFTLLEDWLDTVRG